MQAEITPVTDPANWNAATFAGADEYTRHVTPAEVDELTAVCAGLESRGLGWADTAREHFPFTTLAPLLQDTLRELSEGRGFSLIRGLPLGEWSKDRARLAAWGLGTWVGKHVSQTAQGTRLIDVSDVTGKEPSPRQYKTSQELRLHMDPASDIIGLACVQDAKAGGESVITSAVAVHNAMQALRPDLLALLYQGFHWHRFNEGRPEDGPYTRGLVPVFAQEQGRLACRYVRSPIAAGHKEAGVPLSDAQIEAMDLFDKLAASPELRISFRMQPGDLLLVNNLAVLHARTQFDDHEQIDKRRHMVRLWLEGLPGFRPVPQVLNFFNGGQCGIPHQAGQQAQYDIAALYKERASGGVVKLGL
ncbi:MAG: TauD/TfdA family dioxygenase [Burkholderiales bacterium]|nr:TauD/TfdA family dioxygenase [Burkholderiales bacterium]